MVWSALQWRHFKDLPGPDGGSGGPRPAQVPEHALGATGDDALRCARCAHAITARRWGAAVQGEHEHRRVNPAGVLYVFRCFERADGAAVVGPATTEFTWFEGCAWRFAVCARCGAHLGWRFEGALAFFALVREALVDAGPAAPQA